MVWQIKWVDPSRASTDLNALFENGWEPFAVDGGYVYLRRKREFPRLEQQRHDNRHAGR